MSCTFHPHFHLVAKLKSMDPVKTMSRSFFQKLTLVHGHLKSTQLCIMYSHIQRSCHSAFNIQFKYQYFNYSKFALDKTYHLCYHYININAHTKLLPWADM